MYTIYNVTDIISRNLLWLLQIREFYWRFQRWTVCNQRLCVSKISKVKSHLLNVKLNFRCKTV